LAAVLVAQQYQQTNGSSDFAVAPGMPAAFIFASFDGNISAWNPGVNLRAAIQKSSRISLLNPDWCDSRTG
jgi:hypothetical protein